MTQVYSPTFSALLGLAFSFQSLETEQTELRAIKRLHSLTPAQQKRLGQVGSDLDSIEELFADFEMRPWMSPDIADVLNALRNKAA